MLGGGIFQRRLLLPKVRARFQQLLAGYLQAPLITQSVDEYLVAARADAGAWGAVELAQRALAGARSRSD